ncbi:hypothetical protein ID47_03050 [Candidatus Paracaedibacter acanthamoebae]|uniref:Uncharacterized protein n=1 Tax=Candidatus Odyssella acanthamoebae TaxID=91604 RepID=A0A077AWD0_9PROT|nr:hypothetical protein ID47_03050 [Candidatus Paracaedibacter acanthamoebae]
MYLNYRKHPKAHEREIAWKFHRLQKKKPAIGSFKEANEKERYLPYYKERVNLLQAGAAVL